jgi:hypothetical protein
VEVPRRVGPAQAEVATATTETHATDLLLIARRVWLATGL